MLLEIASNEVVCRLKQAPSGAATDADASIGALGNTPGCLTGTLLRGRRCKQTPSARIRFPADEAV